MTKDVILTISGLHDTDGESDAPIETMTPAQYYMKNGKHYIVYDEEYPGTHLLVDFSSGRNKVPCCLSPLG